MRVPPVLVVLPLAALLRHVWLGHLLVATAATSFVYMHLELAALARAGTALGPWSGMRVAPWANALLNALFHVVLPLSVVPHCTRPAPALLPLVLVPLGAAALDLRAVMPVRALPRGAYALIFHAFTALAVRIDLRTAIA